MTIGQICSEISGLKFFGKDSEVTGFSSASKPNPSTIVWVKKLDFLPVDLQEVDVVLTEDEKVVDSVKDQCTVILAEERSRFYVAKIYSNYFKVEDNYGQNFADHWRDRGFLVGDSTFIGPEVELGAGTTIAPNVTLVNRVIVGENCTIQPSTVIGVKGMGLEWDGEHYLEFPQLGSVIIGNDSEIGPLSTIRKGALVDTEIGSHVKIGSLCNVGHNVRIGDASLLTSSVCISGSALIGKRCFLGVGSTVKNKVKIGERVTVGQGCVVVKDVENDRTVVGNPARIL